MLQGGADKVTFAESTRNFFEKINYSDKELREYPGVYHDIFNDFGYQDILADLVDWLNQHK